MIERRKSKKTFIRYAGKIVFIVDMLTVIGNQIMMYAGIPIEGFGQIYGFLTFVTGFVYGAAGWSDHRKEKNGILPIENDIDKKD
jgi:hypothetical protein